MTVVTEAPRRPAAAIDFGASNTDVVVRDATGATPVGYQPANLDPVGRSVRFSLRKVFL